MASSFQAFGSWHGIDISHPVTSLLTVSLIPGGCTLVPLHRFAFHTFTCPQSTVVWKHSMENSINKQFTSFKLRTILRGVTGSHPAPLCPAQSPLGPRPSHGLSGGHGAASCVTALLVSRRLSYPVISCGCASLPVPTLEIKLDRRCARVGKKAICLEFAVVTVSGTLGGSRNAFSADEGGLPHSLTSEKIPCMC